VGEHGLFFVGSHNEQTLSLIKTLVNKKGQAFKDRHCVIVGQLKGFSDQLSYEMASEQFKVFKYMPYGPYNTVMPYLVRRGQESKQVLREQKFQNKYLLKEVRGRFSPFYK
jgi:proline dehydrogenase